MRLRSRSAVEVAPTTVGCAAGAPTLADVLNALRFSDAVLLGAALPTAAFLCAAAFGSSDRFDFTLGASRLPVRLIGGMVWGPIARAWSATQTKLTRSHCLVIFDRTEWSLKRAPPGGG